MSKKIIVCRAIIPIPIGDTIKICLGQNPPHKKYGPNLWTFPGGKPEPDEPLHLAVTRETRGETKIITVTHDLLFPVQIERPDGTTITNLFYLSQAVHPALGEEEEHDDQAQKVALYALDEIAHMRLPLTESTTAALKILGQFNLQKCAETIYTP